MYKARSQVKKATLIITYSPERKQSHCGGLENLVFYFVPVVALVLICENYSV